MTKSEIPSLGDWAPDLSWYVKTTQNCQKKLDALKLMDEISWSSWNARLK